MDELQKIAEENEIKILTAFISGPKTWGDLLEITKFARGTLAKHIKRLISKGLIVEKIDPEDRRRKIYSLSEKGLMQLAVVIESLYVFTELKNRFNKILHCTDKKDLDKFFEEFFTHIGQDVVTSAKNQVEPIYLNGLLMFLHVYRDSFRLLKDSPLISFLKERKDAEDVKRMFSKVINELAGIITRAYIIHLIESGNLKEYLGELSDEDIEKLRRIAERDLDVLESIMEFDVPRALILDIKDEIIEDIKNNPEKLREVLDLFRQ